MAVVRITYYVNQFLAGMGGEDKADMPLGFREEADAAKIVGSGWANTERMDSVGWICAWMLGVLLLVFLTVGPGRAQPPKRVNIGHCQIAPEAMAVWVAKDQGIFAKYGLDVQLVFVVGDVRIVQVMLAGDIHVSACTLPGMIRSSARGGDTVVVAGLVNHLSFKLWTNASSPIRSVRDLKGKVIGISNLGATTHVVGQLILEEHGLSSNDVTFRGLGASPARLAGLEHGLVDAAVFGGFGGAWAQRLKLLFDARDLKTPLPGTGVISTKRFIRSNSETVERAVRALAEAVAFINDPANKGLVMSTIRRRFSLSPDREEQAELFYNETMQTFDWTLAVPIKGLEAFVKFLAKQDPEIARVKVGELVDLRIIRKLEQSGFIKSLYNR